MIDRSLSATGRFSTWLISRRLTGILTKQEGGARHCIRNRPTLRVRIDPEPRQLRRRAHGRYQFDWDNEFDGHEVSISAFAMSQYKVTKESISNSFTPARCLKKSPPDRGEKLGDAHARFGRGSESTRQRVPVWTRRWGEIRQPSDGYALRAVLPYTAPSHT